MHVTCPACSSRYAIPDAKVAGRRARIKCKRCGELISIDGRQLTAPSSDAVGAAPPTQAQPAVGGSAAERPAEAPPAEAPPPAAPSPANGTTANEPAARAAVRSPQPPPPPKLPPSRPAPAASPQVASAPWTLAQPSGAKSQVDTAALVELYRAGRVEPGALLWREGMDRWLPPYDVPEVTEALKREGLSVPGSDLGASFDDEEEATRVALSPLMPSQPRGAAPSSPGAEEELFGDDEVTRAFEPSPVTFDPSAQATLRRPGVEPPDDDEVTRAFELPVPTFASSPHASSQGGDDDEATRVFDSARLSSSATPGQRLDPSFLGSPTAPPDEAPRPFEARSILSVPPQEETSDVSGLADSMPVLQRTSISVRPSTPTKKRRLLPWLLPPLVLAASAGVVYWRQPQWVERAQEHALTLLGREPAPPPEEQLPPFDTERVGAVLEEAAQAAPRCKLPDGPTGYGRVHVRYSNSGRTDSAQVSDPFAGTEVGECLVALFAATRVPPFSGKAVIVAKNFTVE